MSIIDSNRNLILILSLIVLAGLIAPLLAVHVAGYPSHLATLRGVPVLDSVFAELVKSEPDPVVFPQYPVVETETSITMESDYDGLERVNESVAVSAALEFISRIWYLSEINFSINTGWTNLDDGSWHFNFLGANVYTSVAVNAISGRVNYFSSVWPIDDSPFLPDTNGSRIATPAELEQLAFDFLYQFNYSLSPYARYVGPTLVYDHAFHHDVFMISFYNIVNGSLVEFSGVHLYFDVEASAILRFSYMWVHVDAIPKERIISPERAEQYAIDYLKGPMNLSVFEFEIRSTTLLFDRTWTPTGHEYRLGWIVSINSDYVASIHIDAKSGTPYSTEVYGLLDAESLHSPLGPSISKLPFSYIIWIFMGSTFFAVMISLIVRRQTVLFLST